MKVACSHLEGELGQARRQRLVEVQLELLQWGLEECTVVGVGRPWYLSRVRGDVKQDVLLVIGLFEIYTQISSSDAIQKRPKSRTKWW